MTHNTIMSGKLKKIQFFLFISIFSATNIFSVELDLLCTQNTSGISNHIYPRDLIVRINSDSNQVNIGGLTISTENLEVSESNIIAEKFYYRFNFFTVGIRKNYYKDGSNAVLKEKKLIK